MYICIVHVFVHGRHVSVHNVRIENPSHLLCFSSPPTAYSIAHWFFQHALLAQMQYYKHAASSTKQLEDEK